MVNIRTPFLAILFLSVGVILLSQYDPTLTWTFIGAIAALVAAGLLIMTLIWQLCSWGWGKWWYRPRLFQLGYPPYWPAPTDYVYVQSKTEKVGRRDVLVAIVMRYSHVIQDFDMRFIQTKKGGNVDGNIIRIVGIRDMLMNLSFERPAQLNREEQVLMWGIPNAASGMDCHYFQPIPIHARRALFLTIIIEASQPWQGFLGFRGYDKNGRQAKSSARFMVEAAPSPDKVDSQP